ERRRALAAVAGVSPIGRRAKPEETAELRGRGIVAYPEDIGVERRRAHRSLLAARSMEDLVAWSGGLYQPPPQFRSWCCAALFRSLGLLLRASCFGQGHP